MIGEFADVDSMVVVVVGINISNACLSSSNRFFFSNRVSSLSSSISQIEGQTEARYRKTEGQNHFHSCVFLIVNVNTPSKNSSRIVMAKYQYHRSSFRETTR